MPDYQNMLDACDLGEFHGCMTGDCPHENANDCVTGLIQHCRELHVAWGKKWMDAVDLATDRGIQRDKLLVKQAELEVEISRLNEQMNTKYWNAIRAENDKLVRAAIARVEAAPDA